MLTVKRWLMLLLALMPPALTRLDGNGNLPFAVDFRDLYATALDRWWGINSSVALNGKFTPVDVLKA